MQLLINFLNIVLPIEKEREIPSEPPFNFPESPDRLQLGTRMELEFNNSAYAVICTDELKPKAIEE